jgi:pseudouridine synthase
LDEERGVRLQRVLAAAGVAARRVCERMIEEGRVEVNGQRVDRLPAFVNPEQDRITVNGRPIARRPDRSIYLMVNKPERVLTTSADEPGMGRTTVMDLVEHPSRARLFPVGRLDWQTTGLVLLTNDGALANRLTHPRYGVTRTYRAVVKGALDEGAVAQLQGALAKEIRKSAQRAGRVGPGGVAPGALNLSIEKREPGRTVLIIVVREGRTGSLARMLAAAGVPVRRLERIAIGPLALREVARGRWRELDRGEIAALKAAAAGADGRGRRRSRRHAEARP